ncbi:MAG: hypothetical protein IJU03_07735 [Thermoguttaceae bacterium]|nr:hypothetical protein [Thermoguttaceae bacterium]
MKISSERIVHLFAEGVNLFTILIFPSKRTCKRRIQRIATRLFTKTRFRFFAGFHRNSLYVTLSENKCSSNHDHFAGQNAPIQMIANSGKQSLDYQGD